ncbi:MAG TPA: hypothetical protein VFN97_11420 [Actinospica sp.]|nr:hypothetical protein [Actinospica sp.]
MNISLRRLRIRRGRTIAGGVVLALVLGGLAAALPTQASAATAVGQPAVTDSLNPGGVTGTDAILNNCATPFSQATVGGVQAVTVSVGCLTLYNGEWVQVAWSGGGATTKLQMQTDGNLVLSPGNGVPQWSSKTAFSSDPAGPGCLAQFQSSGNLAVDDCNSASIWSAGIQSEPNAVLAFQANGDLVIYSSSTGIALWSSTETVSSASTVGNSSIALSDGRIALYDIRSDGNVYGDIQTGPNQGFAGWQQLSTTGDRVGQVSALQEADGQIALYTRTTSGTVEGLIQDSSTGAAIGTWTGPIGNTGGVASDPAALLLNDGRICIYVTTATDATGNVSGTCQTSVGSSFATWTALSSGGGWIGKVAAVQATDGDIVIYTRTVRGTVLGDDLAGNAGWTSPIGNTGGVASDPTAIRLTNGRICIYVTTATDATGNVSGTCQTAVGSGFPTWTPLSSGGGWIGRVAAVQAISGDVAIYTRTVKGTVLGDDVTGSGGWTGPIGNTGGVASDPTAVVGYEGAISVYVKTPSGSISGSSQSAAGSGFSTWVTIN